MKCHLVPNNWNKKWECDEKSSDSDREIILRKNLHYVACESKIYLSIAVEAYKPIFATENQVKFAFYSIKSLHFEKIRYVLVAYDFLRDLLVDIISKIERREAGKLGHIFWPWKMAFSTN